MAQAPKSTERADQLVRQLYSNDFRRRNEAVKQLMTMEDAEPLVRKHLKSEDRNVVLLVERLLAAYAEKRHRRQLDEFLCPGKHGHIDLMIERLAAWEGPVEMDKLWDGLIRVAVDLSVEMEKLRPLQPSRGATSRFPFKDLTAFEEGRSKPKAWRTSARVTEPRINCFALINDLTVADDLSRYVAVGTGSFECRSISRSILFVNGSVRCERWISDCIIVCDGEVEAVEGISDSYIIARRAIKCPQSISASIIISSDELIGKENVLFTERQGTLLKSNQPIPLGFIRWFTPADVGLEISAAKDAVKVEKLHDGKLPAKAGLKIGDLITSVDGGKVDSSETFRKLLRKGSVQDRCVLTVKRGDAMLDITLDFRAEERAAERKKEK